MRQIHALVLAFVLAAPLSAQAQNSETLADIRQQLSILYGEIQLLKRELSTTGSGMSQTGGTTTLSRVNALEAQMQQLTGQVEQLQFRVEQIVRDGTNRIGDLEFRLVELEGGDVSQLGETTTLGGDVTTPATNTPASPEEETTELAIGETADFERARTALEAQEYRSAADQFAAFTATYPGSPLESEAHLLRGLALEGAGEDTSAARAFLESYSGDPTGSVADKALFHLGRSLGALGQTNEACVTLGEVAVRHPGSDMVLQAQSEMRNLACP